MLVVKGGDGGEELGGEGVGVAGGEAGGGDGVAGDELQGAGSEVVDVDGEQLVGADEGERDEGDLGFDGHERGAGLEGGGGALGGATTFREDEQGDAGLEGLDAAEEAGDGGAAGFGVDRNLAGALEVPADERDFPERLLGEDAELEGEFGEEERECRSN